MTLVMKALAPLERSVEADEALHVRFAVAEGDLEVMGERLAEISAPALIEALHLPLAVDPEIDEITVRVGRGATRAEPCGLKHARLERREFRVEARRHDEMVPAANTILRPDRLDRRAIEARIGGDAVPTPKGSAAEIGKPLGKSRLGEDGNAGSRHHVITPHHYHLADAVLAPTEIGERRRLVVANIVKSRGECVPIARAVLVDEGRGRAARRRVRAQRPAKGGLFLADTGQMIEIDDAHRPSPHRHLERLRDLAAASLPERPRISIVPRSER
jgi:hypothetical protein